MDNKSCVVTVVACSVKVAVPATLAPEFVNAVAVIAVVPGPCAVAMPVFGSIVATCGTDEIQLALMTALTGALLNVPTAVNCAV